MAGLLGIDLTQPVLFMRLVVPDRNGRSLEVCNTFYRADRYRYEVETSLPPQARAGSRRGANRHGKAGRSLR